MLDSRCSFAWGAERTSARPAPTALRRERRGRADQRYHLGRAGHLAAGEDACRYHDVAPRHRRDERTPSLHHVAGALSAGRDRCRSRHPTRR
jgi:hypothetical protein